MVDTTVVAKLFQMVERNAVREIEELITQSGVNINDCTQDGYTLLLNAASCNYGNLVRKLIELGADIEAACPAGSTALWYACEDNLDDAAVALVEAGASYHFPNKIGRKNPTKFTAEVVKAILDRETRAHGAEPKKKEVNDDKKWWYTFLTENGVPEEVAKQCEQRLIGQGLYTPKIFAGVSPHYFQCNHLSSIGIVGWGLQHLLINLHTELHKERNAQGERLWTKAWIHPFLSEYMVDPEVLTQLFKAVEKDRVEELVDLIGKNGVDINVCQRYGYTLLIMAAQYSAVKCAQQLIELGADVNVSSEDGTAFMHACDNSDDAIAIALVNVGAIYNFPPMIGPNESPRLRMTVVNAILEREKRAQEIAAEDKKRQEEASKPKQSWMHIFLTENGVPAQRVPHYEQILMREGFYTPRILARASWNMFDAHYLTSIGIVGSGLQLLLMDLHQELQRLHKDSPAKPLWSRSLDY